MSDPPRQKFTILVNNQPFTTTAQDLTGAQVKALAGVPADYELFEVSRDEITTVPVGDGREIRIREDLRFHALPSGTFGGRGPSSEAR
jgi:hypothetical protein